MKRLKSSSLSEERADNFYQWQKKQERCLGRLIRRSRNGVITGNSSRISISPWNHVDKVLRALDMNLPVQHKLGRF